MIEAGCLARVVSGLLGEASPNLGLIVKVVSLQGEHSKHGRIWRCEAEYATRGQPGTKQLPPTVHDFAQSWLRRIDDPTPPAVRTVTRDVETT